MISWWLSKLRPHSHKSAQIRNWTKYLFRLGKTGTQEKQKQKRATIQIAHVCIDS